MMSCQQGERGSKDLWLLVQYNITSVKQNCWQEAVGPAASCRQKKACEGETDEKPARLHFQSFYSVVIGNWTKLLGSHSPHWRSHDGGKHARTLKALEIQTVTIYEAMLIPALPAVEYPGGSANSQQQYMNSRVRDAIESTSQDLICFSVGGVPGPASNRVFWARLKELSGLYWHELQTEAVLFLLTSENCFCL